MTQHISRFTSFSFCLFSFVFFPVIFVIAVFFKWSMHHRNSESRRAHNDEPLAEFGCPECNFTNCNLKTPNKSIRYNQTMISVFLFRFQPNRENKMRMIKACDFRVYFFRKKKTHAPFTSVYFGVLFSSLCFGLSFFAFAFFFPFFLF